MFRKLNLPPGLASLVIMKPTVVSNIWTCGIILLLEVTRNAGSSYNRGVRVRAAIRSVTCGRDIGIQRCPILNERILVHAFAIDGSDFHCRRIEIVSNAKNTLSIEDRSITLKCADDLTMAREKEGL